MKVDPRMNCIRALVLFFAVFTTTALARVTDVLGNTATVDLPSNLQLLVSGPRVASIMVRNNALGGTLALQTGSGFNAKTDYEQLLSSYRFSGLEIISSSLTGNTFRIETRTGKQPYDIRRVISVLYVPQAPGAAQTTFTSIVDIPNMSWNTSGNAIRSAAASFKPKAPVFVDKKSPDIFLSDPVRPVSTTATSYTLKGLVTDNVAPTALRVRVQAPKATGFGKPQDIKLSVPLQKTRQWTHRLPMQSAKGEWRIEIRAVDAAGLVSQPVTARITRR